MMNMSDNNAFDDSSVDRAQQKSPQQWADIAKYDYNAPQGMIGSVYDDMDDDPTLGDIDLRSEEEQQLLGGKNNVGGAIDVAAHYKNAKNAPQNLFENDDDKRIRAKALKLHNKNKKENKRSLISQFKNSDNIAVKIAANQASSFGSKFNASSKPQQNVHRKPTANLGCSAWCTALFYWIPIRYLALLGGWALLICPIIDVRWQDVTFMDWILLCYVQLFAIVILFIESPTWLLTRRIQLKIFFWCRVLRRTWGRALFYVTISFMTFAQLGNGVYFTLSMFAGAWMMMLSILMVIFSSLAASQYRSMYLYMRSGGNERGVVGDEYGDTNVDDEKLRSRIASYFNELDNDRDGKIGASEIHLMAEQSLARNLSNAERYTIQTFLDCSCNGYVTRDDWVKQFVQYNNVKFL